MLQLARKTATSSGVRRAARSIAPSPSLKDGRFAAASGFCLCFWDRGSKEDQIAKKLREVVAATHVEVEDISGGCGSMYRVMVVSPEFEGLALVKQHRLVQKAIASEIADMHGLTLKTISEKKYQASLS